MYGPQRLDVALVVDAAHDDQRRAVAEVGVEARQLELAGEQLALLEHVLDGVVRERLERLADLAPALRRSRACDGVGLLHASRRASTSPRRQDLAAADDDRVAVVERSNSVVAGHVDEHGCPPATSSSGPMFG